MERHYTIVIAPDEDGVFIATSPALPGVVEHGDTADEAFENMTQAMYFTLDSMMEEGEALPDSDVSSEMVSDDLVIDPAVEVERRDLDMAIS